MSLVNIDDKELAGLRAKAAEADELMATLATALSDEELAIAALDFENAYLSVFTKHSLPSRNHVWKPPDWR